MSRSGTQTSGTHTGEVRRKIAPKLTCEFVNDFTGEAHCHRLQLELCPSGLLFEIFLMQLWSKIRLNLPYLSAPVPERHSRIRAREEQQEGLKTTNSDLKKEELEVKLRLAQVERELKSLRVHGHELKCQATAIYTNITRITEKVLSPCSLPVVHNVCN